MTWNDLASRAMGNVEILMWNHIIHSWVDPVALFLTIAAVFGGALWALYRR